MFFILKLVLLSRCRGRWENRFSEPKEPVSHFWGKLVFRGDSTWKNLFYISKQKIETSAQHQLHPCKSNLPLQGWSECMNVKNNPGYPGNSSHCFQAVQDEIQAHQWGGKEQNSQLLLFSLVGGLLPWTFSRCQGTWEADTWEHTSPWPQVDTTLKNWWL